MLSKMLILLLKSNRVNKIGYIMLKSFDYVSEK